MEVGHVGQVIQQTQNYLALGKSKSIKQCSETTKNESGAKIV